MTVGRLARSAAVAGGLLLLAGCVAPPPAPAYAPNGAPLFGSTCLAGFYRCPASGQVGTPCACPGLGAPSYGTIQ